MTFSTFAWAGDFHVNPVSLLLPAGASSTMLSVENDGDDAVRFQVSVFTWDQTSTDEQVLVPTDIVIAFPTLFSVEPHKSRILRVGLKRPPGPNEETYRLIVEQLDDVRKSKGAPGTMRVLTRLNLPLFTEVAKPKIAAALDNARLEHGKLSWDTHNTGNVHFIGRSVSLLGHDASGGIIFHKEQKAWYVLRNHVHHNEVEIPNDLCRKASSIEVVLNADKLAAGVSTTVTVTPAQCSG